MTDKSDLRTRLAEELDPFTRTTVHSAWDMADKVIDVLLDFFADAAEKKAKAKVGEGE